MDVFRGHEPKLLQACSLSSVGYVLQYRVGVAYVVGLAEDQAEFSSVD
jgi:hypothetical protein